MATGKDARQAVSRSRLAHLTAGDRDPLGILDAQNEGPARRTRPAAHRADVGQPVRVLPGHRGDPGRRPRARPAQRHPRRVLRGRARLELRLLRVAAAHAHVRPQRLRRSRVGAVGVGSQAPRHERRHRRSGDIARSPRRGGCRARGRADVRAVDGGERRAQQRPSLLRAFRRRVGPQGDGVASPSARCAARSRRPRRRPATARPSGSRRSTKTVGSCSSTAHRR